MVFSKTRGEDGVIKTLHIRPLGFRLYFSWSAVKWYSTEREVGFIWFEYIDEFPSLFIGRLAVFYDGHVDDPDHMRRPARQKEV